MGSSVRPRRLRNRNAHRGGWAFRSCGADAWSATLLLSDGAAAGPAGAGYRVDDDDHEDRPDARDHDRAQVERPVDRMAVEQHACKEAADERADDPEDDVADDAEAFVA